MYFSPIYQLNVKKTQELNEAAEEDIPEFDSEDEVEREGYNEMNEENDENFK